MFTSSIAVDTVNINWILRSNW